MPFKAILFDMFDTLMLIEHEHAFYNPSLRRTHEFLVQNGIDVSFNAFKDAYVKARDALYAEADARMEEPHFSLRVANALKILGYDQNASNGILSGATLAFCEGFMDYVRIDENAEEALKKLHVRYKLGIVSNFAIPECVSKLLQRHGLDVFFDVVIVSAAVNKRKPSPEIFQKALEKLGVSASDAVFVGDTVDADIQGAKSAGMKTIFLERRPQKDVVQACPDQTIKSLSELSTVLEKV